MVVSHAEDPSVDSMLDHGEGSDEPNYYTPKASVLIQIS
jgi:hypothetical protein